MSELFAYIVKGNKTATGTWIIRIVLLLAIVITGYLSFVYDPSKKPSPKPAPVETASPAPPATPATK